MIHLAFDCRCSDLKVHPSNWNDAGANVKKDWYIYYRFYDPRFAEENPKGKLVIVRGMNHRKTLTERRSSTKEILVTTLHSLQKLNFNPYTKTILDPADLQNDIDPMDAMLSDLVIDPATPLFEALEKAKLDVEVAASTKIDITSVLKYCKQAATDLRIDGMSVSKVRRRHIKAILARCGQIKSVWTARTFNYYKAHLSIVFTYLVDEDVIESNPLLSIKPQKITKKKRAVLSDEQRIKIDTMLRHDNYEFWRMMHIFFHSGARTTELLKVQKKHVNLEKQEVTYTIEKGASREVIRPIKDIALPLWQELISESSNRDQFLFSKGLKPGDISIHRRQISIRWQRWVKNRKDDNGQLLYADKHGNEIADWYSLKHSNSTELSEAIGTHLAAKLNQHAEEILRKNYDVKGDERDRLIIRSVRNEFAPTKQGR